MNESNPKIKQITIALLLCFLIMLQNEVSAQSSNGRIKGRVYDSAENEWVIAASVRLTKAGTDSTLVKGATTNAQGNFELQGIKPGQYRLTVTFIGLEPFHKDITLTSKNPSLDLGRIDMVPSATSLAGVEVTGKATPIILKQDTVEFNASSFQVKEGSNVEELLKKLPGVEVDSDGKITYNGESIERLEVDGKDFFSSDPKMASRNLPSMMVNKIQVVDKKSEETRMTGIDDGTRTKVLNLEIKPEMKKGIISNFTGAYGTKDRYSVDGMLNYFDNKSRYSAILNLNNTEGIQRGNGDVKTHRLGLNLDHEFNDKLELTSELGYDGTITNRTSKVVTENLLGDGKSNINESNSYTYGKDDGIRGLARFEWKPDSLTWINFTPEFSWRTSTNESSQTFSTINSDEQIVNQGSSNNNSTSKTTSGSFDLNASRRLSSSGRNIYMGLSGSLNQSDGDGMNSSTTEFLLDSNTPNEIIDQMTLTNGDSKSIRFRTSYTEPIAKNLYLQLSYRLNMNWRNSDRKAYNKDDNGDYTILDQTYTKGSDNVNRSQSIGTSLNYNLGKQRYSLGFEAIPTYTYTKSSIGDNVVYEGKRTVWNYAPTARIDYRPSDSLRFEIRYRGNTSQPSMEQLNPAVYINSALSRTYGNPDLLPSFSHQVRFNWDIGRPSKRQNFGIRGNFNYTNNAVVDRRTIDPETGMMETTYENVSGIVNANASIMAMTPITKNITFFMFGWLGGSINKAYVNNELNTSYNFYPSIMPRISWSNDNLSIAFAGNARWSSTKNSIADAQNLNTADYSIRNEIDWQLPYNFYLSSNLSYTTRSGYAEGFDKDMWIWNVSLAKDFLKNNMATIKISGFDLLGQRTNTTRSVSSTSITDSWLDGVTQYFMVSLKFKLNSFGDKRRSFGGSTMGPPPGRGTGFGGGRPPRGR